MYARRAPLLCRRGEDVKGYPFEVALPPGLKIGGVVLSDHTKNLDWAARKAEKAGVAPAVLMSEVRSRIAALLGIA
jgi:mRNA interferase MazF